VLLIWTSFSAPLQAAENGALSPGGDTGGKPVIAGGASIVHVQLGNVRDILLDVRRAQVAVRHLYGEVTRHPITNYNYVDVMGPVVISLPEPTFDVSEVLPARQKWVDLYMQEITPTIPYIQSDLESIISAEAALKFKDKVKAKFELLSKQCTESMTNLAACGLQLQQQTAGAPYDNLAIAKRASELHKELRRLEKLARDFIKEIKKSGAK